MPTRPCTRARWRAYVVDSSRNGVHFKWWYRGKRRGISLPLIELETPNGRVSLVCSYRGDFMPEMPKMVATLLAAAKPGPWGKDLPVLASWLCESVYPNKQPIGKVQLQVTRNGNIIRATLKIEDQDGLRCSAIGESPAEALLALEMLLAAPKCPWEQDDYPLGGKGKKKK